LLVHVLMMIQVWDNDGEFLLIEAAYHLPRWLKPESAANRVWLRGGNVHLVPPPGRKYPQLPPFPTPAQALEVSVARAAPAVRHDITSGSELLALRGQS
jgi:hypothetical protein